MSVPTHDARPTLNAPARRAARQASADAAAHLAGIHDRLGVLIAATTALAETVKGVRLRGDWVRHFTQSRQILSAPNTLTGCSIRETTGAAGATVILHDGRDNTGDEVTSYTLDPGESARDSFGRHGLNLVEGLYVEVVSGSVKGAVYLGDI
jgi:hypothetical protein